MGIFSVCGPLLVHVQLLVMQSWIFRAGAPRAVREYGMDHIGARVWIVSFFCFLASCHISIREKINPRPPLGGPPATTA